MSHPSLSRTLGVLTLTAFLFLPAAQVQAQSSRTEKTLASGAIGAGGGALLSAIVGGNVAVGAAVGGGVGLLVGHLRGKDQEKEKKK